MRIITRVTPATCVLIAALLWAGTAQAGTETQTASAPLASGGTVSAKITYTPKSYYDANIALTITRDGSQLLSQPVTGSLCGKYCVVQAGNTAETKSIHVVDVQGSGEPDVFVDLYSGGAHCCSITNFYTYSAATQSYQAYEHTWGDPGYSLEKLGGAYVFETNDDRFAYAFTDYAASGLPLALFSFNGTKLVNVTRRYPKLIAENAASNLAAFKDQAGSKYSDSVGVIAAWAADEDELGKSATVAAYLEAQARLGHLNSALHDSAGGTKFIRILDAFLMKAGYLN